MAARKKATPAPELKDNSIKFHGSILSSQEKTANKSQVVELHVCVPADEFDGNRDTLSRTLEGTVLF